MRISSGCKGSSGGIVVREDLDVHARAVQQLGEHRTHGRAADDARAMRVRPACKRSDAVANRQRQDGVERFAGPIQVGIENQRFQAFESSTAQLVADGGAPHRFGELARIARAARLEHRLEHDDRIARPDALAKQQLKRSMHGAHRQGSVPTSLTSDGIGRADVRATSALPDGRITPPRACARSRPNAIRRSKWDRTPTRPLGRTVALRGAIDCRQAVDRFADTRAPSALRTRSSRPRETVESSAPFTGKPIANANRRRSRIAAQIVAQANAGDHDADFGRERAPDFADAIEQRVGVRRGEQRREIQPTSIESASTPTSRRPARAAASPGVWRRAARRAARRRAACAGGAQPAPPNAHAAQRRKTGAGRAGTKARAISNPPALRKASGRPKSCAARSTPSAPSPATRVTIMPIAIEIRNAGSVVTSALPIERSANVCSASSGDHAVIEHADHQPAGEIERDDHQRRDRIALDELARAVHRGVKVGFALHARAFAPRAVGIERAGVNVGVDRHLLARHRVERETRRTSATRCEPVAITMNWIVIRIANTIRPTTILPCTTNSPNAGMIAPTPRAWPCVRISRVATDVEREPEERREQQRRRERARTPADPRPQATAAARAPSRRC